MGRLAGFAYREVVLLVPTQERRSEKITRPQRKSRLFPIIRAICPKELSEQFSGKRVFSRMIF
jgi:hypothetical protein